MKYVVYILTAVLAVAAAVVLLPLINLIDPQISDMALSFRISYWVSTVPMAAVAAMAVVQLFRSTPRLMLLFAGSAFFKGISLFVGQWIPTLMMIAAEGAGAATAREVMIQEVIRRMLDASLLMLAAGLLPALYVWIRHGLLVKAQPKRDVKKGLLIAAGIMACINLAQSVLSIVVQVSELAPISMMMINIRIPSYIFGLLVDTGLLVTCFMMKRRTGVLYRMFFVGPIVMETVLLPLSLIWWQETDMFSIMSSTEYFIRNLVLCAFDILTAVFVIIHALKHREDFAPPMLTPQTYDEPEASAAE